MKTRPQPVTTVQTTVVQYTCSHPSCEWVEIRTGTQVEDGNVPDCIIGTVVVDPRENIANVVDWVACRPAHVTAAVAAVRAEAIAEQGGESDAEHEARVGAVAEEKALQEKATAES